MSTTAVTNQGCCYIQSPQTKKIIIGAAGVTALVSTILVVLGAVGILPHVGNLAAITAGSVLLAGSIVALVIVLCIQKKIVTPPREDENARQEEVRKFIKIINEGVPDQQELWDSINLESLEAFKVVIDKLLLAKKDILNLKDRHDCTLFHYIAMHGTSEMLNYLQEQKVPFIDSPSYSGYYVMHCAAIGNNHNIISTFVKLGANVNQIDKIGNTPLHYAVAGKIECVKALITAGASNNIKNNETLTPAGHLKNLVEWKTISTKTAQEIENCLMKAGQ